jgi:hypothetical protein
MWRAFHSLPVREETPFASSPMSLITHFTFMIFLFVLASFPQSRGVEKALIIHETPLPMARFNSG